MLRVLVIQLALSDFMERAVMMTIKTATSMPATVLLAVLAFSGTVRAQEMAGIVTDTTGAVMPGVSVTARHTESGNTYLGVTDAVGQYRIGALRTGLYHVTAELAGFATVTRDNLELLVGQRAVVDFKLTISTVQESVTVTGQSPLIETTQSKMGGNVDSRQMQELPVNGRNWMSLTLLAPGSRVNTVSQTSETPTGGDAGTFQLNLDGQQVTTYVDQFTSGQPKFSRDAIAEFELITSRFDATQGRSNGVQVNAVTKSGTNTYAGSLSGYFRDARFIAKDFIVNRVLPYSDQQVSGTFGGPIRKDKVHFFGNYEVERNPQSFTFTSPYPTFNIPDLRSINISQTAGVRADAQINQGAHVTVRANGWLGNVPYDPMFTGGAILAPSKTSYVHRQSGQVFASYSQTIGQKSVNEIKVGLNQFGLARDGYLPAATPEIRFAGYTLGKTYYLRQSQVQNVYSAREDFSTGWTLGGRHDVKLGVEAVIQRLFQLLPLFRDGVIDATGVRPPANLESFFPVWNDPSTWNLAALSPYVRSYTQSFGDFDFLHSKPSYGAWFQDNWTIGSRVTLNLGLRYDLYIDSLANNLEFLPFLHKRPQEKDDIAPRLGFAYAMTNTTVIRGGFGKYYAGLTDVFWHQTYNNIVKTNALVFNDGRADFAVNPFNGVVMTQALAKQTRQSTVTTIASDEIRVPYAYQTSIGFQQQIGGATSIQADFVWTGTYHDPNNRNINLGYNPATGVNYPFNDAAHAPYPDWGVVSQWFSEGHSNYRALQTAFTRRFSDRWQLSATYTLSGLWNLDPSPVQGAFPVSPDLGGQYGLAVNDQRHRAVLNGVWELPYGFQASGLYFFGSGLRFPRTFGADLRQTGGGGGRLRPDGTIIPRNDFVGKPLHRVDLRVLRHFPIVGRVKVDGMVEVFNLFNHANYGSYVTQEVSPIFGSPTQNIDIAYQPRMMQLGVRLVF